MFKEVRLKRSVQAVQVTNENVAEICDFFDGEFKAGVLRVSDFDNNFYLLVGYWIVMHDSGALEVHTDEEYSRIFEDIPVA